MNNNIDSYKDLLKKLIMLIKEKLYLKINLKNNLLKKTHLIKINKKKISYIKKIIYKNYKKK